MLTMKLEGFKELDGALGELPKTLGKGVLRRVLKKAAEPIRAAAEAKAPRLTGTLKANVITSVKNNKANSRFGPGANALIGVARGEYRAFKGDVLIAKGQRRGQKRDYQYGSNVGTYAKFVEFGTNDTPAQPFLRPALDQHGDTAVAIIGKELGPEIEKTAARLARKRARG